MSPFKIVYANDYTCLLVQAGCHDSGWKFVNVRHIFFFTSNQPLSVWNMIDGGLKG